MVTAESLTVHRWPLQIFFPINQASLKGRFKEDKIIKKANDELSSKMLIGNIAEEFAKKIKIFFSSQISFFLVKQRGLEVAEYEISVISQS